MPLIYPFRTAYGEEDAIESVLVRMWSGEAYGWGESSPWRAPFFSSEWAHSAFELVRDWLAPSLIARDIQSGEELQRVLAPFRGNLYAKASLDLAWWDLMARMEGRPLWQLLGGRGPTVTVGADLGVRETLDQLLSEIAAAQQAGFTRVKLKYRPGWELNMLSAVRSAFPNLVLHVDCNSAYSLDDLPMFEALDHFNLAMIEQPLAHDDLWHHAQLQTKLQTPICLDESITTLEKARKAISLKACRWINLQLGRVGGLTNALAIHDLCQAAHIPCWVGSALESAVGQAHNLAVATLPNIQYPSDIFPSSRFYADDLGHPHLELSAPSQITALSGPGIGCEPHAGRLEQHTLERAIVR